MGGVKHAVRGEAGAAAAGWRDGWRDVAEGLCGVAVMAAGLLTPFGRGKRGSWGVGARAAARRYPGDELVPRPRWSWTHGIQIEAQAGDVWPWVAQISADRGGFYSYQWLENLIGCQVRNAATIHPDWAARPGGELRLHPKAPALRIVSVEPGRALVAYMAPVPDVQGGSAGTGEPLATRDRAPAKNRWMTASWLFFIERTGPARCRVISRYRCATSDDLVSRLQFGPATIEPIGFAMDRRMLIGLKQRAERAALGAARFRATAGLSPLSHLTAVRRTLGPGATFRREVMLGKRLGAGLVIAGAATAAYVCFVRQWHLHWGATKEEARGASAGDELMPGPDLVATRAVEIDAPPSVIWPWLVQMGRAAAARTPTTGSSADSASTSATPIASFPSCRT